MGAEAVWSDGVCVFCGSSDGRSPEYAAAARQLGEALAAAERPLIYGGGTSGLMGAVATATLNSGGRVWGIIPRALLANERGSVDVKGRQIAASAAEGLRKPTWVDAQGQPSGEVASRTESSSRATLVASMHERKQVMAKLAQKGFVALPGGFGTFEEVLEAVTWTQLGIHRKPVVLLNVCGLFSPLRHLISGAVDAGFIPAANAGFVVFVDPDASSDADWGARALSALDEWYKAEGGMGGGKSYALDWKKA